MDAAFRRGLHSSFIPKRLSCSHTPLLTGNGTINLALDKYQAS